MSHIQRLVGLISKNGHQNRQIVEWNRIKDQDINPHICVLPIFDKEARNSPRKKDSIAYSVCIILITIEL